MGGKALKNIETRRYERDEYMILSAATADRLRALFPEARVAVVPAYATKPDYGDADILISSDRLPGDWVDRFLAEFKPDEYVPNGAVKSFNVEQLQVDLITSKEEEFDFALTYFSYNDLGNLMGRIAHKQGFKYGHDGFHHVFRDGNQSFRTNVVSRDIPKIFAFLGYEHDRFRQGFETLEDVFRYAGSSPYFNKDIYLWENVNHTARRRDAKRKTYNGFLDWLETEAAEGLPRFAFNEDKSVYLPRAFEWFPDFEQRYRQTEADYARVLEFRQRFNGEIVREVTGLEGKELGAFIMGYRARFGDNQQMLETVLAADADFVRRDVAAYAAEVGVPPEGT